MVKAVYDLPEPWKEPDNGRPPHKPRVVAVMCAVKTHLNKTYESAEAYGKSCGYLKELLGEEELLNDRLPPQSVIHRGMEKLSNKYIRELNRRLTVRFRRKGIVIGFDSTGIKLRTSSLWYDIRIERETRKKDFVKLHIAGCMDTGIIHNYTITAGRAHDSPQLKKLVKVFDKIVKAVGDAGYLSRNNCTEIVKKGGKPFFMLKCNVTAKPKSSPAWKAMIRLYWKDPVEWLREYHVRSFVEAIFSSVKKRFGNFLRSVRKDMQKKELALRVVCYNVIRVLYVETAKKLGLPLWVKA